MMRGARFCGVSMLLVLAASLGVAPRADAATKIKVVRSDAKVVKPGRVASQRIACPKGMSVMSGGVSVTPGALTALAESLPFDGRDKDEQRDDGWRAVAINLDATKIKMRAYAVCSKGIPLLHIAFAVAAAPGLKQDVVNCPVGTEVVGGGVGLRTKDTGTRMVGSSPADGNDADSERDDRWFGEMFNPTAEPIPMTIAGICAEGTHDYTVATGNNNGVAFETSVVCADGSPLVGGGVFFAGSSSDLSVQSIYPEGPFWKAIGANQSGAGIDQTVVAICREDA